MNLNEIIQPGVSEEENFIVAEEHVASQVGSGGLRVLATPILIMVMEKTSHRLLARRLPAGLSSVGILVNIRHLAPTPMGSAVRVVSEVLSVEGQRVTFSVHASDEVEQISEGIHERVVIDEARFLKRVANKMAASKAGG